VVSQQRRKICVVTGTRAEYGLLYWLMKEIQADDELVLQIVVTGMHLSPEFGMTYQVIEADGFVIDEKVEMLLSSDTPVGIAKSIGLGVIGFADALERLKPDLLVLLGDRFEILSAAQAALIARIPVAHIGGGDTTEGAIDEQIRHCISIMSCLHFPTNSIAVNRLKKMGINSNAIFCTGSLGIDQIVRTNLFDKVFLEKEIGVRFQERNLLITYHPATLDNMHPQKQIAELLSALESLDDRIGLFFTLSNADAGGRLISSLIAEFAKTRPNCKVFTSLGTQRYLSMIVQVDAVVGNSSSGLYEVPSLGVPTVNIGNRQKGRLRAASVIECRLEKSEIIKAINKALDMRRPLVVENPYGRGDAAKSIVPIIKQKTMKHNWTEEQGV